MDWNKFKEMRFWIFVACNMSFMLTSYAQEPKVRIRQGALKGILINTERGRIEGFLGIPYALAPTGNRRFASPEQHGGWNGTLDAIKIRSQCPQPDHFHTEETSPHDEDCLYLNVWTPQSGSYGRPWPVMLIFEGRHFVWGSPASLPGQDLAAEAMVVVTAAYRLNVFGFFCLEDEAARGNLGLLDQYLVMLWVRENIIYFGGDPGRITLAGHDAGAAAAMLHLLSPRTIGMFQRVILMSGSALSPWSTSPNVAEASWRLARSLGCPMMPTVTSENQGVGRPSVELTLSCMRSKSTTELLRAFQGLYEGGNWTSLPLPTSDSFLKPNYQYLPLKPLEGLTSGAFQVVPILTGITNHDGSIALLLSDLAISKPSDIFKTAKDTINSKFVDLEELQDLRRQTVHELKRLVASSVIPAVAKRYGFTSNSMVYSTEEENALEDTLGSEEKLDESIRSLLEWQYMDPALFAATSEEDARIEANALLNGLLQLYTDAQFKAPHAKQVQILATRAPVYAYRLDQRDDGSLRQGARSMPPLSDANTFFESLNSSTNAGYGTELQLLLGPEYLRRSVAREFSRSEDIMARQVKLFWRNFAESGEPLKPATAWRRYTIDDPVFMSFSTDGSPKMKSYSSGSMDFADEDWKADALWNHVLPRLRNESELKRRSLRDSQHGHLVQGYPFRSTIAWLITLVVLLVVLLGVCLVLLKRRSTERHRGLF